MTMKTLTDDQKQLLTGLQPRVYASYELREAETTKDGRYLQGRAVPYNVWTDTGWYMERVEPGTFAKSIEEAAHGLPLLLNHDSRKLPIGVAEEWTEEDDGLVGLWRIDEDDELAMRALSKAGKGMLTGLSVGFIPIEDWRKIGGSLVDVNNEVEWDDTGTIWVTRRQARLLETSLTPIPADVGADVLAIRELRAAAQLANVQTDTIRADKITVSSTSDPGVIGRVDAHTIDLRPRLTGLAARMKELNLT